MSKPLTKRILSHLADKGELTRSELCSTFAHFTSRQVKDAIKGLVKSNKARLERDVVMLGSDSTVKRLSSNLWNKRVLTRGLS